MRCARALGVRSLPVDYRAPTANGVKCSVAAGYALEGCCRIGRPSERVRMLPVVLRSLGSRLRLPRTRSSAGHESSRDRPPAPWGANPIAVGGADGDFIANDRGYTSLVTSAAQVNEPQPVDQFRMLAGSVHFLARRKVRSCRGPDRTRSCISRSIQQQYCGSHFTRRTRPPGRLSIGAVAPPPCGQRDMLSLGSRASYTGTRHDSVWTLLPDSSDPWARPNYLESSRA
jgi:hypothetical protein